MKKIKECRVRVLSLIIKNTRRNFMGRTGRQSVLMLEVNLRSGSILVSLGETFRREGRNEK